MRFLILVLMLTGCGEAARADITAHYRHRDGDGTMRIEVAENGDSRLEVSGEMWRLIHKDGVSYVVYSLPGGPLVTRVEDLQRLAAERGGEPPRLPISDMRILPQGEARIGEHAGRAYHVVTRDGPTSRPQIVISNDPALRPLGPPWLRQIDFTIAMLRGRGAPVPATITQIREIVATGTPIFYGGQQLHRIDRGDIPPDRFRLPAEPMTLEQLRSGGAQALLGPTV